LKIPSRIRYFNKRFLNRLTGKIARSSWGPFCILRHVGRRSGKLYETPIIAFPIQDGFVIALTYGPQVDWYRNIRAAGRCSIQWHGRVYEIHKIEPLDPKTALTLLPGFFKKVLGLVGLQDFIKLTGQSPHG
jgi:deazaflavin-dependent oxidoreductase (nitroreductase family)